jgi:hypothetical protein
MAWWCPRQCDHVSAWVRRSDTSLPSRSAALCRAASSPGGPGTGARPGCPGDGPPAACQHEDRHDHLWRADGGIPARRRPAQGRDAASGLKRLPPLVPRRQLSRNTARDSSNKFRRGRGASGSDCDEPTLATRLDHPPEPHTGEVRGDKDITRVGRLVGDPVPCG